MAKFKESLKPITVDPQDYTKALQGLLLEVQNRAGKMELQLAGQGEQGAIQISDEKNVCGGASDGANASTSGVCGAAKSKNGDVTNVLEEEEQVPREEQTGDIVVGSDHHKALVEGADDIVMGSGTESQVSDLICPFVTEVSGPLLQTEEKTDSVAFRKEDSGVDSRSCSSVSRIKSCEVESVVLGKDDGGVTKGYRGASPAKTAAVGSVASQKVDSSVSQATTGDDSDDDELQTYKGKSHNKRRQCPFCDFLGTHLGRHLQSQHPEKADNAGERARLVYKTDEEVRKKGGKKTTLTNPEECLYQCGLPGCTAIVSRMSQHLRRAHKLTDPGRISVAKRSFKRLAVAKKTRSKEQQRETSTPCLKTDKGKELIASQTKLIIKPKASTTSVTSTATSTDTRPVVTTKTAQKVRDVHQDKPKPKKKVKLDVTSSEESGGEDEEVSYDDDSDDSLQESSEGSEGGEQLLPQDGLKWGQFYRNLKERDATTMGHFVSCFFKYLLHVEGGCHSEEQALIHTRQVNIIFDTIDPLGEDLNCLVKNDGLDFWDKFCSPKLKKQTANRQHA